MSLLDKCIVNLRIISKIQENGKISTVNTGQICLEDESVMTPVWRTVLGDSRDKTIAFLLQLINDVSEITDSILSSKFIIDYDSTNMFQVNKRSKHIDDLTNLSRQLQNSKKGFVNLHSTYKCDANIASKLEEIMEKADSLVLTIERSLLMLKDQDKNVDTKSSKESHSHSRIY